MKAYVTATGVLFGLLFAVHAWRAVEEGWRLTSEPFFVISTVLAAGMAIWAWRLVRAAPRA